MRRRLRARLLGLAVVVASAAALGAVGPASPATAGTRYAPSTSDTGEVYDLVIEYMFNNGNALVSPQDANQIQQDLFEPAPVNKLYYVKQVDTTFWERFGIADTTVALERDTTAPPGSADNSYDFAPWGSTWMPRHWVVGQETSFSSSITWFNKYSCAYTGRVDSWAYGRHFLRYQGSWDMGGSLGVQDVIVVDRYHWISDDPANQAYWNSPYAERFWYARGHGWVRWDDFTDRRAVFNTWNSVSAMENPGASHTVRFTRDNPGGNGKAPNKLCDWLRP